MNLLAQWLLNALVISVSAYLLTGVHVNSFTAALAAALVLGVVNVAIRPLLYLLTLPVTMLSIILFSFIVNLLMVIVSAKLVPGFYVESLTWACIFSGFLSLINYVIYKYGIFS